MPSELKRLRYVAAAVTELRRRRPLSSLPPEVSRAAAALQPQPKCDCPPTAAADGSRPLLTDRPRAHAPA